MLHCTVNQGPEHSYRSRNTESTPCPWCTFFKGFKFSIRLCHVLSHLAYFLLSSSDQKFLFSFCYSLWSISTQDPCSFCLFVCLFTARVPVEWCIEKHEFNVKNNRGVVSALSQSGLCNYEVCDLRDLPNGTGYVAFVLSCSCLGSEWINIWLLLSVLSYSHCHLSSDQTFFFCYFPESITEKVLVSEKTVFVLFW